MQTQSMLYLFQSRAELKEKKNYFCLCTRSKSLFLKTFFAIRPGWCVCFSEAAALQQALCMLEIWDRNQPAASNAEQLSVSWVTEAYCLLAAIKCTAGPTSASSANTHACSPSHTLDTRILTLPILATLCHRTITQHQP